MTLTVAKYSVTAKPIKIVFFSDLHVHGPDLPPKRLQRIVAQINALHGDIDVIGGDFVGNNWIGKEYPVDQAIAPLRELNAKLGVFAVLGNNDYKAGGSDVTRALERAGVRVLVNEAVPVGPIALGGIDGRILRGSAAWNRRRNRTYAAMAQTPGIPVVVAHRPDEFRWTPSSIPLVLAGHTHCGQIVLPLIGPLETGSDFGREYLCGIVRRQSQMLIVTAGIGTSHVPLRISAPADIWVISIRGVRTGKTRH